MEQKETEKLSSWDFLSDEEQDKEIFGLSDMSPEEAAERFRELIKKRNKPSPDQTTKA